MDITFLAVAKKISSSNAQTAVMYGGSVMDGAFIAHNAALLETDFLFHKI